jgi:peroxiredoxin
VHNLRRLRILFLAVFISLILGSSKAALASEIILNDLNGRTVQLSNYLGKPVILFFWTTWCPYCRKELKKLNQEYSALTQEVIVVLGVNVSETDYKVKKFFEGYSLNFKILLDRSGLLSDKYDLLGVPTYVLLDAFGEVVSQTNSLPGNYMNLLFK